MIVKILSSAKNFEGIDYSERKNDQGKSQLLMAKNFEALKHGIGTVSKADYINYMKLVCDANPRVKNRQFHAVISAKGDSYSPRQLSELAEIYLKSMGYDDNPYLIYFHADTDNNHVHMVSTRVDKNGNKVDDTFEKIRSQKAMQEILEQDPRFEAKSAVDHALTYFFSTIAQFKMLLEQQGFKITENDGQLNLIKYGLVQTSIDEVIVQKRIKDYQVPETRIRQLKAIFHKYKNGIELDAFIATLHQKFGIEIMLHQSPKHQLQYGFTIIDHTKKQVLKGSQVMSIRELLNPISDEDLKQLLDRILKQTDYENSNFYEFQGKLKRHGFEVDLKGHISMDGGRKSLGRIDPADLKLLKYNWRVQNASQFYIGSEADKAVLAKLFHIDIKDIDSKISGLDAVGYYKSIIQNIDQSRDANELLQSKKMEILSFQQRYYLMDMPNKHLFEIDRLVANHGLQYNNLNVKSLENPLNIDFSHNHNIEKTIGGLAQLFDIPTVEINDPVGKKRKKKRQRKI